MREVNVARFELNSARGSVEGVVVEFVERKRRSSLVRFRVLKFVNPPRA